MSAAEYWRSGAGLGNITPRGKLWPEGPQFPAFLQNAVGDVTVLEFGCGIGRLARLFPPSRYVGADICAQALARAAVAYPAHRFVLIADDDDPPLPEADTTLAHTVLLHVPDDRLAATVERFQSHRVIVSEILGRGWRRDGDPPVFNREAHDYAAAFAPRYRLMQVKTLPYPHYPKADLSMMEFERC